MSKSRYKSISIVDFFYEYPYKTNIQCPADTIPTPYIKKKDCIYNSMTLDYNEWKAIINRYLELIMEMLAEGEIFKMPLLLGKIEVKRVKVNRFLDRIKSVNAGKQVYMKSNGHENRFLIIDWMRQYREANFVFKWHWKLKPNREFIRGLYKKAEEDYTFINKFRDKVYD